MADVNVIGAQRWIQFHHLVGDADDSRSRILLPCLTNARDAKAVATTVLLQGIILLSQLSDLCLQVVDDGISLGRGLIKGLDLGAQGGDTIQDFLVAGLDDPG